MSARILSLLLFAAAAFAAVDGVVINGTTGQPAGGVAVALFKFGDAGMEPLDTTKTDAQGKFAFAKQTLGPGPHMLQMGLDGVAYNHMLQPGTPSANLQLEVFNASKQPGAAKVEQHMVLLEPSAGQLAVSETFFYRNAGKTTFNDPAAGTLHLFLPEAAEGKVRVSALAPGGMSVERIAERTGRKGVYKVDFPIKPGETRIDAAYQIPFANPGVFQGKTLAAGAVTRLVVPKGVTIKGEGLEALGEEPSSKAAIFGMKGESYSVEVSGEGGLRNAAQPAEPDESEGPGIQRIPPRIHDQMYPILGISLAILMLGFLLLYRRSAK